MNILLSAFHILFCLSIIVIILMQSNQQTGLSSSISGGADTFFGKHKGGTLDAILGKYTTVVAGGFLVTSIWLQLIMK